ncbi:type I DNA topoisomerase [Spirochaetia bacterium 38H-sp]|uniref:DNA topoisomerase 1 n=1 Tax=Rarispira pelagica TaxID=3141764 RepID=A0ABU9UDC2_9SPIR
MGKSAKGSSNKKGTNKKNKKINTLLIVESPAKASTIEKYLGPGYKVEASKGHLIDLPKSRLAVDINNSFEPEYITVRGKAEILRNLIKQAKEAGHVMLASDNDREGEAISFHIKNAIEKKYPDVKIERIVFNEITPSAIRAAVENPGDIDENKVDAQKSRRVLDRLVGYNLSPILWKKVKNGLSAGRVQSVALRLICEREKEVESFVPEEYWSLDVILRKDKKRFNAVLVNYKDKKPDFKTKADADAVIEQLRDKSFTVISVREVLKQNKPKPPFTTSQLQQVAANRLGYNARKTMQIAQRLYEGVSVGSTRVGLITYMRTDSTRISETAISAVRDFIGKTYPDALPEKPRYYSKGGNAQDAHEAIRPTFVEYTPDYLKNYLSRDEHRLYSIIWERFVASQMNNSSVKTVSVDIGAGEAVFRTGFSEVVDKGFLAALSLLKPADEKKSIPVLNEGDSLKLEEFIPEQHFTSGPSRYTDATIVKAMEELGIGRPSTYAPTISVLFDRFYVQRKNKQIVPTALGKMVNDILVSSFPDVLDVDFTARMESRLDMVESGEEKWVDMISDFFFPFKEKVEHVMEHLESVKVSMDEETGEVCPKCGRPMVKKIGRYGYFIACTGFPECRYTMPIPVADCPVDGCGGKIVERKSRGKRGRTFYGCTNYPDCTFLSPYPLTDVRCPTCGWPLVEKSQKGDSVKVCINPDCDYLHDGDAVSSVSALKHEVSAEGGDEE